MTQLKQRRHPRLWQSYLMWEETMQIRKRHLLRKNACERGVSNMDAQYEQDFITGMALDTFIDKYKKEMITYGKGVGPVWEWTTSIKGLGSGSLNAQLLAQIDWIGPTEEKPDNYATVAQLWRNAGFGLFPYWHDAGGNVVAPKEGWQWKTVKGERTMVWVVAEPKEDWELKTIADRGVKDWVLPYNKALKSICYNIADQFIRQQTPGYVEIYYDEKEYQRRKHPEKVGHKFSDAHIHNRAWRKMIKQFLKDLWVVWRTTEGLPVTDPHEKDTHALVWQLEAA